MNLLKRLRELDGHSGEVGDEVFEEEIDCLGFITDEEFSVSVVQREMEEGGRWSDVVTEVFELNKGDYVAYFRVIRDVPASEIQDGMDLDYCIDEVFQHVVQTVVYKTHPQKEDD